MGDYYYDYGYDDADGSVTGTGNDTAGNNGTMPTTPTYNYDDEEDYLYDEFIYPGFAFERPIYLVLWECLVLWTLIFNIIVVMILIRRKLRNPTNIILAFIAVSDSLTGLVTLPTYIYVYRHFESGQQPGLTGGTNDHDYVSDYAAPLGNNTTGYNTTGDDGDDYSYYVDGYTDESMAVPAQTDFYILTKAWCQAFMISKFFVSKAFHTISIWLTLFLGIQRYISVRFPFKARQMFSMRNTLIVVFMIYCITPWLHVYHLVNQKARDADGMCEWTLEESCKAGCAYLWLAFLFMHFIPCVLLVIFTVLMVIRLYQSTAAAKDSMNREKAAERNGANRRITIVVFTIVIVFLIPEIPYGFFLLYSVLRKHANLDILTLEINRTFHAVYELLLVITFHANFWIYTGLNRRFRFELRKTFAFALGPMYRAIGASFRRSFRSGTFSRSSTGTMGRTMQSDLQMNTVAVELKPLKARDTST